MRWEEQQRDAAVPHRGLRLIVAFSVLTLMAACDLFERRESVHQKHSGATVGVIGLAVSAYVVDHPTSTHAASPASDLRGQLEGRYLKKLRQRTNGGIPS